MCGDRQRNSWSRHWTPGAPKYWLSWRRSRRSYAAERPAEHIKNIGSSATAGVVECATLDGQPMAPDAARSIWHGVSMNQVTAHQAMTSTTFGVTKLATRSPDPISSRMSTQPLPQQGLPSRAPRHARAALSVPLKPSTSAPQTLQPHPRTPKRQKVSFHGAVAFADRIGCPLNTTLTIAWEKLENADDCHGVHWQRLSPKARDQYLRKALGYACGREGMIWAAVWGRDIGRDVGAHIHILMHWPRGNLAKLIADIERITGAADFVKPGSTAAKVARSWGGGWQIDRNIRPDRMAGTLYMADYILGQHDQHPAPPNIEGKAFGITEAIGPKAQSRAAASYGQRKGH
jgi:hypothetical protein